jgi:hypothetical protein
MLSMERIKTLETRNLCESAKNGGHVIIRLGHETEKMLEWFTKK